MEIEIIPLQHYCNQAFLNFKTHVLSYNCTAILNREYVGKRYIYITVAQINHHCTVIHHRRGDFRKSELLINIVSRFTLSP